MGGSNTRRDGVSRIKRNEKGNDGKCVERIIKIEEREERNGRRVEVSNARRGKRIGRRQ